MEELKEIAIVNQKENLSDSFEGGIDIYSSINTEDKVKALKVFGAMQNAVQLQDYTNQEIKLTDIIAQKVQRENENTGELEDVIRTVLLCESGVAYSTQSPNVLQSIKSLTALLGHPSTWSEPVSIKAVKKKATRSGKEYLTVESF